MEYRFEMLPNEYWWGGTVSLPECPLTVNSDYEHDFCLDCNNQTMPFYLSSKGRYIWSDHPFKVRVKDGVFTMDGKDIELYQAGSTLKEAYLEAQKLHFPCDGKALKERFFTTAQYNTWMEFNYFPTQEGVLAYAHGWIDRGYAPGVFIIDEGWHKRYGEWTFDEGRFPDPKAMIRELHNLGFIVMLWVVPFVCADGYSFIRSLTPFKEGEYPEANVSDLYMRNRDGKVALVEWWNGFSALLNLNNPRDEAFLDDQLQTLIREYGVDGFKFDGGTPELYSNELLVNGPHATAMTPHELNQAWNQFGRRYPYHEYKDTYKGGGINCIQRLRDKHHTWDGVGINALIPCAFTCGLIGHPFVCPDMIGGGEWKFNYIPGFQVDEELFVRMAQCSALFPMMQFSWAPWRVLSEENQKACVAMAELHQRLSPEILRLVHDSEKSGEPILRPLEYNDPGKGYESITDEFMLGENLLSAPVVTKGTRARDVQFPQGTWTDEDGNLFEGGKLYHLNAPLDKLLWFRRVQ